MKEIAKLSEFPNPKSKYLEFTVCTADEDDDEKPMIRYKFKGFTKEEQAKAKKIFKKKKKKQPKTEKMVEQ